jgi:hypothetical protein
MLVCSKNMYKPCRADTNERRSRCPLSCRSMNLSGQRSHPLQTSSCPRKARSSWMFFLGSFVCIHAIQVRSAFFLQQTFNVSQCFSCSAWAEYIQRRGQDSVQACSYGSILNSQYAQKVTKTSHYSSRRDKVLLTYPELVDRALPTSQKPSSCLDLNKLVRVLLFPARRTLAK